MTATAQQRVRCFRIASPSTQDPPREVQYGYWQTSNGGINRRFTVLRSWPADSQAQAEQLKRDLEIDVLTHPELLPPADAQPLPTRSHRLRDLREAPTDRDVNKVLHAIAELPDELPSIEESSRKLGIVTPAEHHGGRNFYVHLNDQMYRLLLAVAVNSGQNRNRIVESLLLFSQEAVGRGGQDPDS